MLCTPVPRIDTTEITDFVSVRVSSIFYLSTTHLLILLTDKLNYVETIYFCIVFPTPILITTPLRFLFTKIFMVLFYLHIFFIRVFMVYNTPNYNT